MKYALITGSTKGIGKAIATQLLEKNYFVILNYFNDDKTALRTKNVFQKKYGNRIVLIKEDLSTPDNIASFYDKIILTTNKLDVLILNAGKTFRSDLDGLELQKWNDVLNTNLTVPLFLVQKIYPLMKNGSSILFTGSLMGIYPHSLSLAYGVSKAAVHALIMNLVKYLIKKNIRINCVAPGFVETEWQINKSSKVRKNIINKIAVDRFATPMEIASVYLSIINNEYINGQIIIVDGGYGYK